MIIDVRFIQIDIIEKSLHQPSPEHVNTEDIPFTYSYIVDVKVEPTKKMVIGMMDVTILEVGTSKKLAFFKIACIYELANFDQLLTKTADNKYDIPVDIEILIKASSISTMRGIIFMDLKGTYLHNAILPLIDIGAQVRGERAKLSEARGDNN